MKEKTSLEKAVLIARFAADKKGEDIILLEMPGGRMMCDLFVLVTASSARRMSAISNNIKKELSRLKVFPLSVEGRQNPYWVLQDYEDVVVHIFHKDIRGFYGLEDLWSDVPKKWFDGKCFVKRSQKK